MYKALIKGLICDASRDIRVNNKIGCFLHCTQTENPESYAAITALKDAGLIIYDSRTDLVSSVPKILKNYHFCRGKGLWEPRIEDGEEVPQDRDSPTFIVIARDAQVFHAHRHRNTGRSVIWIDGDIKAWSAALGDLVVKHKNIEDSDKSEQKPRRKRLLNIDSIAARKAVKDVSVMRQ